jgi:hypothetical protein
VNKTLPITRVDVVRAAYGLIDEYGSEALARAMDRASAVRRDGFESVRPICLRANARWLHGPRPDSSDPEEMPPPGPRSGALILALAHLVGH